MSDFAVDVRNISKRFRLAHGQYNSLKERIIHGGKRQATEDFWALNEVSLTVREGQTVGILGRNGSGKSTLLKCICGILQPTTGEVAVRGRLAGLLELGAGFQQDLTGRENIYLNGSLLGMSKRDVDRVFDAIVDFSELEEFIDGPVKFYSSGMYVRLGFAVAVHMDPDILVIDEVLAVGDERFQRKCIDRVTQFQREGRTILLVTHSADTVRSICDRGVVLSHGRLIAEGEPGEATRIFREGLMAEGAGMSIADPASSRCPPHRRPGAPTTFPMPSVRCGSAPCTVSTRVTTACPTCARATTSPSGSSSRRCTRPRTWCSRSRSVMPTAACSTRTDTSIIGMPIDAPRGTSVMHFGIVGVPLLDGSFSFALGIQSRGGVLYDWMENAGTFEVMNPGKVTGSLRMNVHAALISTESDIDSSAALAQNL